MKPKSAATKDLILSIARHEFLNKGFRDASLRDMAKQANGTTGVIYTYFENKNDLFETLTRPVILEFEDRLATEEVSIKEAFETSGMDPETWFTKNLRFLIGLIKKYPDQMKLLFLKSDGSSLQNYKDLLIEQGTIRSLSVFRTLKRSKAFEDRQLSEFFVRNLVTYVINVVVEMLKQNKSSKQITYYEKEITSFLFSGWKALAEW